MKHSANFKISDCGASNLPDWVPDDARAYLAHTGSGRSMRALAREVGGHASTISRFVQRLETRRDDPLVDGALVALEAGASPMGDDNDLDDAKGSNTMPTTPAQTKIAADTEIETEARRILRRLCETSAFLIVAPSMEKAAIMRETVPGKPVRIAVVDRHIAQAFALKDWIESFRSGKITSYRITTAGKNALKRLLARDPKLAPNGQGFAEAQNPFQEQHKEWGERKVAGDRGAPAKRMRYNLAESPITALGRRKDSDGQPVSVGRSYSGG
jgi:hypothetical protein